MSLEGLQGFLFFKYNFIEAFCFYISLIPVLSPPLSTF